MLKLIGGIVVAICFAAGIHWLLENIGFKKKSEQPNKETEPK